MERVRIAEQELTLLPERTGLARLGWLVDRLKADRLVILGDLFHSEFGRSRLVMDALADWRSARRSLNVVLVRGNHDAHTTGTGGVPRPVSESSSAVGRGEGRRRPHWRTSRQWHPHQPLPRPTPSGRWPWHLLIPVVPDPGGTGVTPVCRGAPPRGSGEDA